MAWLIQINTDNIDPVTQTELGFSLPDGTLYGDYAPNGELVEYGAQLKISDETYFLLNRVYLTEDDTSPMWIPGDLTTFPIIDLGMIGGGGDDPRPSLPGTIQFVDINRVSTSEFTSKAQFIGFPPDKDIALVWYFTNMPAQNYPITVHIGANGTAEMDINANNLESSEACSVVVKASHADYKGTKTGRLTVPEFQLPLLPGTCNITVNERTSVWPVTGTIAFSGMPANETFALHSIVTAGSQEIPTSFTTDANGAWSYDFEVYNIPTAAAFTITETATKPEVYRGSVTKTVTVPAYILPNITGTGQLATQRLTSDSASGTATYTGLPANRTFQVATTLGAGDHDIPQSIDSDENGNAEILFNVYNIPTVNADPIAITVSKPDEFNGNIRVTATIPAFQKPQLPGTAVITLDERTAQARVTGKVVFTGMPANETFDIFNQTQQGVMNIATGFATDFEGKATVNFQINNIPNGNPFNIRIAASKATMFSGTVEAAVTVPQFTPPQLTGEGHVNAINRLSLTTAEFYLTFYYVNAKEKTLNCTSTISKGTLQNPPAHVYIDKNGNWAATINVVDIPDNDGPVNVSFTLSSDDYTGTIVATGTIPPWTPPVIKGNCAVNVNRTSRANASGTITWTGLWPNSEFIVNGTTTDGQHNIDGSAYSDTQGNATKSFDITNIASRNPFNLTVVTTSNTYPGELRVQTQVPEFANDFPTGATVNISVHPRTTASPVTGTIQLRNFPANLTGINIAPSTPSGTWPQFTLGTNAQGMSDVVDFSIEDVTLVNAFDIYVLASHPSYTNMVRGDARVPAVDSQLVTIYANTQTPYPDRGNDHYHFDTMTIPSAEAAFADGFVVVNFPDMQSNPDRFKPYAAYTIDIPASWTLNPLNFIDSQDEDEYPNIVWINDSERFNILEGTVQHEGVDYQRIEWKWIPPEWGWDAQPLRVRWSTDEEPQEIFANVQTPFPNGEYGLDTETVSVGNVNRTDGQILITFPDMETNAERLAPYAKWTVDIPAEWGLDTNNMFYQDDEDTPDTDWTNCSYLMELIGQVEHNGKMYNRIQYVNTDNPIGRTVKVTWY